MLRADTMKLKGARRRMVQEVEQMLSQIGIADEKVMEALMSVPRHQFFDSAFDINFTYQNNAFSIGAGQTISQPYIVALQTHLLDIKKRDKILEIGTGSGYQAAVLLERGGRVYTIERQKQLFDKTSKLLPKMGYMPKFFYGDGYKGLPEFAPFDKVIITAGAPFVPEKLIEQLRVGGVMVIPIGETEKQTMYRITKVSETETTTEDFGPCSFVPMLPKVER
ncbi:protein-L-isoaspartate(D-aspartate) O-methyltransferase [bacterium SCSIO 12643]|nr:protein-L-isoaspartate(D-aspartate) O-methyltransferase [bacterium SCSIO 12643]